MSLKRSPELMISQHEVREGETPVVWEADGAIIPIPSCHTSVAWSTLKAYSFLRLEQGVQFICLLVRWDTENTIDCRDVTPH